MTKKLKGYYVLLCDDSKYHPKSKYDPMVCGVYSSRKEARDVANEIKDCVLKHTIKKCDFTITF